MWLRGKPKAQQVIPSLFRSHHWACCAAQHQPEPKLLKFKYPVPLASAALRSSLARCGQTRKYVLCLLL